MDGSNNLLTRYVAGDVADQVFARVTTGSVSWFLTDYEGSVRNLTDGSGNLTDTIAYDAYGNITSESNAANGGRMKWDGGEQDSETGYDRFNRRFYNPATGSWTEQDPAAFAAGDPILAPRRFAPRARSCTGILLYIPKAAAERKFWPLLPTYPTLRIRSGANCCCT